MAVSNFREARQAVRDSFLHDLNGVVDPNRIAWENRIFNPPDPTKSVVGQDPYWVKESTSVIVDDLLALHMRRLLAVTTFYVLYPVGKGTERVEDLTQAIADAFEMRRSSAKGNTVIGYDKVERNTSEQFDNVWWSGSVSIYWRTYIVATSPLVKSI